MIFAFKITTSFLKKKFLRVFCCLLLNVISCALSFYFCFLTILKAMFVFCSLSIDTLHDDFVIFSNFIIVISELTSFKQNIVGFCLLFNQSWSCYDLTSKFILFDSWLLLHLLCFLYIIYFLIFIFLVSVLSSVLGKFFLLSF